MNTITQDQIARAYALMECERAPRDDHGYGYNPARAIADRFLKARLISESEWLMFIDGTYEHGDCGLFREAFLDLFARYEHQNPLPVGQRYRIGTERYLPVISKTTPTAGISEGAAEGVQTLKG